MLALYKTFFFESQAIASEVSEADHWYYRCAVPDRTPSRESGADNRQILKLRGRRSPRRVDKIFKWIDTQIQHVELTPKDRSWQRVELTTFILTIIW